MERESFEDEQVAQLMNDNFISIKIDREELPGASSPGPECSVSPFRFLTTYNQTQMWTPSTCRPRRAWASQVAGH